MSKKCLYQQRMTSVTSHLKCPAVSDIKKIIPVFPPAPVGLVASLYMFVYRWCYLFITAGTETQNYVAFLKLLSFCSYHVLHSLSQSQY